MDKSTIYTALTVFKVLILIAGMAFVLLNFASWLTTKDGEKLKKAAIIFGGTFLSIVIISGIEFIIAFN